MLSKIQHCVEPYQVRSLPQIDLLNTIINSTDDSVLYELSRFLSIAFRKRKLEYITRMNEVIV